MEEALTWNHLYFEVEDSHHTKVFQSAIAPLVDNACAWEEQEGLILKRASLADNHTFYFKFYLAPHFRSEFGSIFWFCKEVKSTSFVSGSNGVQQYLGDKRKSLMASGFVEQYAFDMRFQLRIAYHCDLRSNEYLIANYYLSAVHVHLKPTMVGVLDLVHLDHMHKVVCVAGAKTYLGRAQEILTESLARTYTWRTKETPLAFPGLAVKTDQFWDNHVEQHRDMQRLRAFNEPLSARLSVMKNARPYMPDNDWFHNPLLVSPLIIHHGEALPLTFYNLGNEERVMHIGTRVEWSEFDVDPAPAPSAKPTSPRILGRKKSAEPEQKARHVMRQLSAGLSLVLGYVVKNGNVWIQSIALRASHFAFDLQF